MKTFFVLIIFLSTYAFASNPSIQEFHDKKAEELKEQNPEVPDSPSYKEDIMIYYRVGDVVGRFPNPDKSTMYSFGYRRLPSTFFYGIEYSKYISENSQMSISTTQAHVGYRVIWNNRFLPYAALHVGTASLSDNSGAYENTSGIATGVEVGLDLMRFKMVKFSSGLRYNSMTFKSSLIPQSSFTELYTIIGLEF